MVHKANDLIYELSNWLYLYKWYLYIIAFQIATNTHY